MAFRETWREKEPDWFNAPVPSFGPADARLLIVGLAPGLRGANRTGRPFTGDYAGDLLYATLKEFGFAKGEYAARPDDGLTLIDCRITNAVRCVPPENKPTPKEIATCRDFLSATLTAMTEVRAIVVLGRIAHETVHYRAKCQAQRTSVFPRLRLSDGTSHPIRELSLLALQHVDPCADAANVSGCVCPGARRTSTRCA